MAWAERDAIQMSAVLRHVAKYRGHWRVDFQAQFPQHRVGAQIVENVFAFGSPPPSERYDAEVQILLYDTWCNWEDRPNTRVASTLHNMFDLPWDADCGRYQVHVEEAERKRAEALVAPLGRQVGTSGGRRERRIVGFHYQGESSQDRKNLTLEQGQRICDFIEKLGYQCLLFDWRDKSSLPDRLDVHSTGRFPITAELGGDPAVNCALIGECQAFIGIDSGPAKCAGATETPSLVVWTGHHPSAFYDPAPNVTHLVPCGYDGLFPVQKDGVLDWFEQHHLVRMYDGEHNIVVEVERWLRTILD